jgi:hypothetical protein
MATRFSSVLPISAAVGHVTVLIGGHVTVLIGGPIIDVLNGGPSDNILIR